MVERIIDINQFDYPLPDTRIARYPLEQRDDSLLLVYNKGAISHSGFSGLAHHFSSGDIIVFNNSRVVPARLLFQKKTGALIEVFCLEPHEPSDYQLSFAQRGKARWACLLGNAKKWKEGRIGIAGQHPVSLTAEQVGRKGDNTIIEFCWDEDHTFSEMLSIVGHMPIPPYLSREDERIDKTRYQTVFSEIDGSVAAPTAGLHFTESILTGLASRNCSLLQATLHVGAGTFLPVKTNNAAEHRMHGEHFTVTRRFLKALLCRKGTITAVGTTSARTLESLYWLGVKCTLGEKPDALDQWEAYRLPQDVAFDTALHALIDTVGDCYHAETRIMIVPGYRFRVAGRLITNFHQPRSTLLLLVSAFLGSDNWKKVYDYALAHDFRFLSYGDSSLLIP